MKIFTPQKNMFVHKILKKIVFMNIQKFQKQQKTANILLLQITHKNSKTNSNLFYRQNNSNF